MISKYSHTHKIDIRKLSSDSTRGLQIIPTSASTCVKYNLSNNWNQNKSHQYKKVIFDFCRWPKEVFACGRTTHMHQRIYENCYRCVRRGGGGHPHAKIATFTCGCLCCLHAKIKITKKTLCRARPLPIGRPPSTHGGGTHPSLALRRRTNAVCRTPSRAHPCAAACPGLSLWRRGGEIERERERREDKNDLKILKCQEGKREGNSVTQTSGGIFKGASYENIFSHAVP